jgi:thiamine kinase-like enzyme
MESPGKALEICKQNIPSWESVTSLSMTLLTGTSNKVYLVEASESVSPKKVIYRVYRYRSIVISELERLTFRSLIGRAKVPAMYGEGPEWRLEEYFNGRSLNRQEFKQDIFIHKIADSLRTLHGVDMSDVRNCQEDIIMKHVEMWRNIAINKLPSLPAEYQEIFSDIISADIYDRFLKIYPSNRDLKFCHSDSNYMNFLYNEEDGGFIMIDFEYSGYANPAVDLAFVLNETMYNYYHPDPPYFTFHPDEGPSDELISKYVKEYGGGLDFAVDVMRCMHITHLFWAMWGVCMYTEPGGFDYLGYAAVRFGQFKKLSEEYQHSGSQAMRDRISKFFE